MCISHWLHFIWKTFLIGYILSDKHFSMVTLYLINISHCLHLTWYISYWLFHLMCIFFHWLHWLEGGGGGLINHMNRKPQATQPCVPFTRMPSLLEVVYFVELFSKSCSMYLRCPHFQAVEHGYNGFWRQLLAPCLWRLLFHGHAQKLRATALQECHTGLDESLLQRPNQSMIQWQEEMFIFWNNGTVTIYSL